MSISNSLLRAAKLQEKIDLLRGQLSDLLEKARSEIAAEAEADQSLSPPRSPVRKARLARGGRSIPAPATTATQPRKKGGSRPGGRVSQVGLKRAASPTGPLAPAVVKVLRKKRRPMRVHDILSALLTNGYQFNSPDPRRNLAARIYRLKGVKQVDAGLFGLA